MTVKPLHLVSSIYNVDFVSILKTNGGSHRHILSLFFSEDDIINWRISWWRAYLLRLRILLL